MILALIPGLATVALQVSLLFVLIRKHLVTRFPWFSAYTGYSIAAGILRGILLHRGHALYTYAYWLSEIPYAVLGIAALCEALDKVVRPFYVVRAMRLILPATVVTMVAMAGIHVLFHPPIEQSRLWAMVLAVSIAVRNLQVGILIVLVGLSLVLPIARKQYAVSVVHGFGIAACGMLISGVIRSQYYEKLIIVRDFGPAVAYLTAAVIWLRSFRRREELYGKYETPSPDFVAEMRKEWSRRLRR